MTLDLRGTWLEFALASLVLVPGILGSWFLIGWWERVMTESAESRSMDRRFLRWQWALFRRRYPLGHWSGPNTIPRIRFLTRVSRGIIILMGSVWVLVLSVRLFELVAG